MLVLRDSLMDALIFIFFLVLLKVIRLELALVVFSGCKLVYWVMFVCSLHIWGRSAVSCKLGETEFYTLDILPTTLLQETKSNHKCKWVQVLESASHSKFFVCRKSNCPAASHFWTKLGIAPSLGLQLFSLHFVWIL
jgi:hypothetical protein